MKRIVIRRDALFLRTSVSSTQICAPDSNSDFRARLRVCALVCARGCSSKKPIDHHS